MPVLSLIVIFVYSFTLIYIVVIISLTLSLSLSCSTPSLPLSTYIHLLVLIFISLVLISFNLSTSHDIMYGFPSMIGWDAESWMKKCWSISTSPIVMGILGHAPYKSSVAFSHQIFHARIVVLRSHHLLNDHHHPFELSHLIAWGCHLQVSVNPRLDPSYRLFHVGFTTGDYEAEPRGGPGPEGFKVRTSFSENVFKKDWKRLGSRMNTSV